MNIKKFFTTLLSMAFVAIALQSCVNDDDWETPPINCENKFPAPNISMADLMLMAPATGYLEISTALYRSRQIWKLCRFSCWSAHKSELERFENCFG